MLQGQGSTNSNHLPIQTIFSIIQTIFSTLCFPQLPSFHCFTRAKYWTNKPVYGWKHLQAYIELFTDQNCCMHYYLMFAKCSIWFIQAIIDNFITKWKNLEFVESVWNTRHGTSYEIFFIKEKHSFSCIESFKPPSFLQRSETKVLKG